MDTAEIIVLLAGVALIVFVLWYFFAGEGARSGERDDGGRGV